MNADAPTARLFHRLLDCSILLSSLVILAAVGWEGRAGGAVRAAEPLAAATGQAEVSQGGAGLVVDRASAVMLDNNTLAAMIAAENAALTPPQYLVDLPAVLH